MRVDLKSVLIRVNINGLMVENIVVNGKIIICMEKVFTHGRMEGGMKVSLSISQLTLQVNIFKIRKTALVSIDGLMAESTKGTGKMESNTVVENISYLMVQ